MSPRHLSGRVIAVFAVCFGAFAPVFSAAAHGTAWSRHPERHSLIPTPAGVPIDYVRTRQGYFHSSCVVALRSDEVLGNDLVIRGIGGAEHERMAPCKYPRYSLTGRLTPAGRKAIDTSALTRTHAGNGGGGADVYDGWIIDYYFSGSVPAGTNISTEWLVPALPTKVGNQDIAFFNDIETNNLILQPVLDFSEIPGKWAIESENCCLSGNDVQSELVQVSPGDRILGVVTAASCDSTGVCKNWTVTTTDVTTGKSTVLNMQNPKEAANEINPAVLETYNVTSCDMLPANGEVAFYNNVVTSGSGVEPLKYTLDKLAGMAPAGFPKDCGYGGAVSGNTYTLYFGKSPAPIVDAAAGGGDVDSGATGGMGGLTGADAGNAMGGSGGSSNTGADGGAAGTGAAGTGAAGAPGSSPGTDAPGSSTAGAAGPSGVDASSNPASGGGGSSSSANRGADRASGGCDIANPTNPHGMSPSFIGLGIGLFLLRRSRRRRG